MTMFEIECVATCTEPVTVERGEPVRCGCCGTKYDGATVLSSPLSAVEPGEEARRIAVAEPADPPATVEATPVQRPDGQLEIDINLNVNGGEAE